MDFIWLYSTKSFAIFKGFERIKGDELAMTISIGPVGSNNNQLPSKWEKQLELAKIITLGSKLPQQVILMTFKEVMEGLTLQLKISIDPSLKKIIWKKLSGKLIEDFSKHLQLKVAKKILGTLNEKEIDTLLHPVEGDKKFHKTFIRLEKIYQENSQMLQKELIEETSSTWAEAFSNEIVEVLCEKKIVH
jgi:hypothetical protein